MTTSRQETLVNVLAHVRKRPGMYFGEGIPAVVNFLTGFMLACDILEPVLRDDATYKAILQERGWELSSAGIWKQMETRGYSQEAIIDEMLAIYETTVARLASTVAETHQE